METLEKMINVFAWITLVGCPILIALKIWLQSRYENSLEKTMDNLNGLTGSYSHGIPRLFLFFIIALVFLIVK